MLIWSKGRSLVIEEYMRRSPCVEEGLERLIPRLVARVPGTGVFMSSSLTHLPPVLVHIVERERILHEQVVLLTVVTKDSPEVSADERLDVRSLGNGAHQVVATYGFMQTPDVPAALADAVRRMAIPFDAAAVTYYLGRESVLAGDTGAMGSFAEGIFGYLQRNAVAADRHFKIPVRQVIEVGIQLDL
jgi:KUP system potassium uptake protein